MKSSGPSKTKGLGVPGDPGEGFSLIMAPPPGTRRALRTWARPSLARIRSVRPHLPRRRRARAPCSLPGNAPMLFERRRTKSPAASIPRRQERPQAGSRAPHTRPIEEHSNGDLEGWNWLVEVEDGNGQEGEQLHGRKTGLRIEGVERLMPGMKRDGGPPSSLNRVAILETLPYRSGPQADGEWRRAAGAVPLAAAMPAASATGFSEPRRPRETVLRCGSWPSITLPGVVTVCRAAVRLHNASAKLQLLLAGVLVLPVAGLPSVGRKATAWACRHLPPGPAGVAREWEASAPDAVSTRLLHKLLCIGARNASVQGVFRTLAGLA